MTPSTAVERKEDTSVTINPVKIEALSERMHNLSAAIAKRAYEIFEGNGRRLGHDLEDWCKAELELLHPIQVEVSDSGSALDLKADVHGFNEKEIQIGIEPCRVTLVANRETQREHSKAKTVCTEFCANYIRRVVDLPVTIDPEKASASLQAGVVRLNLPKATGAKMLELKLKAA
jgi:HSP20 family protein